MTNTLREKAAQASGQYSDEEWAKLVASKDQLDQCTVTNARACAANVLALPEIAEALELSRLCYLHDGPGGVSVAMREKRVDSMYNGDGYNP